MCEKQSHLIQCIIDCLKAAYSIEVSTLTLLPLGADMNASVYKAIAKDCSSYFVKQKRGPYNDIQLSILELLHNAKIQEIIRPIKTIDGQSAQHIDDFSLIVYPYIEGQDGFSRALTDEQWFKLAKVLRQIHEINVPASLQQRLRRETYSSKWRDNVRALYASIDSTADDEIALKLLAFLKKNTATIHCMVDRAEQLAQKLQNDFSEFVLCHSDIHAGNILINANNAIYIVDWDEPIMAPKERDLMFIGGGVGNVWNKSREEEIFYKGYGKTVVNMEILAYYRYERIVEDIALFGQRLLLPATTSADKPEMYKQFINMFEANGVVDIAFKTAEKSTHWELLT